MDKNAELEGLEADKGPEDRIEASNGGEGAVAREETQEEVAEELAFEDTPEALTLEQIEALKNDLETYRIKAEEHLDGWQRALADFANYKKRVERTQSSVYQNAFGQVVRRFLEISDDLERALKDRPQDGDGVSWAEGIDLIYRKLQGFLETEGVTPMQVIGQPFDPNLHEAISMEESAEFKSGHIIEVVQTGYLVGDRVLRPARVRIAQ